MLIMYRWMFLTGKFKRQEEPAKQSETTQSTEAPTAAVPAKTTGPTEPKSLEQTGWRIKTPKTDAEAVIFGKRIDDEGLFKAEITIDPTTAAVSEVWLSEHKLNVDDKETGYPMLRPAKDRKAGAIHSMMLGKLKLEDRNEIFELARAVWSKTKDELATDGRRTVEYTAHIVDENEKPTLDVIKQYGYGPEDYELELNVTVVNHYYEPLNIEYLEMYGPVGLSREDPRTDRRSVAAGFFGPSEKFELKRPLFGKISSDPQEDHLKRPNEIAELKWYAVANKFFAAIVQPMPFGTANRVDYIIDCQIKAKLLTTEQLGQAQGDQKNNEPIETLGAYSRLKTTAAIAPPGADRSSQATFPFRVYLGPVDSELFAQQYAGRHYEVLMRAGMCCASCSFDWLTIAMLKVMKGIYLLVHNYGVAIIVLVLIVRFMLHPILKKSQVNMMQMSKNMGKLQPKIEEIRKKYAGNKQEIQKHTWQVYKEHGSNPLSGCLGMLPMFLQMPIWIGLYTACDANIALRHKGLLPASWHWLTDLSAPDRLIPFEWLGISPVTIPLVGTIDAFNLLPLLLCVAMFLQQKLSAQATMVQANPQAAQQQKMMLIMMPIMMLVFLYNAPSGVNLYIMSSTFAGVIEQHYIRKHLKEKEQHDSAGVVTTTAKVLSRIGEKKPKPKLPRKYM